MAVVVIGILNTLAIAVRERTREIGTLRAIGMQRRKVLWLFLLETALLGLAGAASGRGSWRRRWPGCSTGSASALPEGMQLFLMQERLTFLLRPGTVLGDVLVPRRRDRGRLAPPGPPRRPPEAHHRHAPRRVNPHAPLASALAAALAAGAAPARAARALARTS